MPRCRAPLPASPTRPCGHWSGMARCSGSAPVCARAEKAEAQLAEAQAQLAAIQTQRASRKRRKHPASPSPDWLLVEEVRGLFALSVGALATRLGLKHSTVLGKAQDTPLSHGVREKLLALKSEHLAANREQ